jgi:hypothetical protein
MSNGARQRSNGRGLTAMPELVAAWIGSSLSRRHSEYTKFDRISLFRPAQI